MTSNKNGELPAFAVPLDMAKYHTDTGFFPVGCGITKREYFAAMAMQGIISSAQEHQGYPYYEPSKAAELAIAYTDELLKQLES